MALLPLRFDYFFKAVSISKEVLPGKKKKDLQNHFQKMESCLMPEPSDFKARFFKLHKLYKCMDQYICLSVMSRKDVYYIAVSKVKKSEF